MEHIYNNPSFGEDWFTYPDLYKQIVQCLPTNAVMAEVGVWKGKSIAYFAVECINANKNVKCVAVDTWKGSPGVHDYDVYVKTDSLYELFITNVSSLKNIIPIRATSTDAAKQFENNYFDFIFIDANHEYNFVKEDILAWYPKLKTGGIIAGHDYLFPGVNKAVNELFPTGIIFRNANENCWIYKKE